MLLSQNGNQVFPGAMNFKRRLYVESGVL